MGLARRGAKLTDALGTSGVTARTMYGQFRGKQTSPAGSFFRWRDAILTQLFPSRLTDPVSGPRGGQYLAYPGSFKSRVGQRTTHLAANQIGGRAPRVRRRNTYQQTIILPRNLTYDTRSTILSTGISGSGTASSICHTWLVCASGDEVITAAACYQLASG